MSTLNDDNELRQSLGDILTQGMPNPATGLYDIKSTIDRLEAYVHQRDEARDKASRLDELELVDKAWKHGANIGGHVLNRKAEIARLTDLEKTNE